MKSHQTHLLIKRNRNQVIAFEAQQYGKQH